MREKVRNSKLDHRINRRGGTSPSLVCIELNPGPKRKAARKTGKKQCKCHKGPQLDELTKGKIAMGVDLHLSRGEIQRQLGVGKGTVQMWADRYKTTGKMERKAGSGRPRKTTEGDDRYLLIQCKKDRKKTAGELRKVITNEDDTPKVTERTICNRLLEAGYAARVPLKKPLLTKSQRQKRLQWAKAHKDWGVERWRQVLWSDETSFSLFPRPGNVKVRRKPGEETRDECMVPTVKHGGGKIMVWGSFHASGVGILRKISGIMNQHQYHTILTNSVMPQLKKLVNDDPSHVVWLFQQDNDPKHTAKKNKAYLKYKEQEGKINFGVLPWPSNSPDLNPIEHVWNRLKDALRDRRERPSNLEQLFSFVEEEWQRIPRDYLRTLVDSLPSRISAVIKNHGGSTKY